MRIYEIGTGYTSIPAKISAATEIIVEQLTIAMLKLGANVQIVDICDNYRAKNDLPIIEVSVPKKFVDADVQLGIMHKLKRVVYSISLALKLKEILKSTDETIVFHFHNQYNLFFFMRLVPASLRKKCITAYTNHSGIWRLDWTEIQRVIRKRYFQEVDCMKKADLVYLLNDETKENVIHHLGIKENHIVRINNGVNTNVYCPLSETKRNEIRNKYSLDGKKVVLQVGSVYENKGQLRAVKLLAPLLQANPNWIYVYAGGVVSEEYQTKITDFAKMKSIDKQVRYMGMLSPGAELNELYNAATITILSSIYEGFSLVVIEAMAAGVPVLIHEKAPFSLGDGCVIYSEKSFKNVMDKIMNDDELYNKYCVDARMNAVKNYSWNKIALDYLNSWK